jgi:SagB-type dehydrogenase family enzyme
VPNADGRSVVLTHSLYGSRFEIDAHVLATLLMGERARPDTARIPAAALRSVIEELVREQVLVEERSGRHGTYVRPDNSLSPVELAVLRGANDGGMKATRHGPPPSASKPSARKRALQLQTQSPTGAVRVLAENLSARESIRSYTHQPLSRRALEQFLQLTVRAYARLEHPDLGPTSLRNYPSGGGRYPLEIYPLLLNVRSLKPGFYHYQPFHHRLERLGAHARYADALRRDARARMGRRPDDTSEPAVLFIITAVFTRTSWKYQGIPLQLILQETGALYQTMYLTATAMGLAPCAVGAFPERAVAEILGLDPAVEGQVGLFALGSPSTLKPSPLRIEHFAVHAGSPFDPGRSRASVELTFKGGEKETIDAQALAVKRFEHSFACAVRRGREWAVLEGKALTAFRHLLTERHGVLRVRVGGESVIVSCARTLPSRRGR